VNDKAYLNEIQAVLDDGTEVDGETGDAISASEWSTINGMDDLTGEKIGTLDFNSSTPVAVTFNVNISRNAKASYAVTTDSSTKPADNAFKGLNEETTLYTNNVVYVKVVSENNSVINYYCLGVDNAGTAPSNNVSITLFKIGDGEPVNPTVNQGSADIGAVTPIEYELPGKHMTGSVTLELSRNNANQKISWGKISASTDVLPIFVEFAQPDSGNVLSATVNESGLTNDDIIYIKVIAANDETVRYYGFTISVGNIAELDSLKIGSEDVTALGVPGTAWNNAVDGVFDYQGDVPANGLFALEAAAKDDVDVMYAVTDSTTEPTGWAKITSSTTVQLEVGSYLYLKITSLTGNVTKYYKIKILMKVTANVLYGQPEINKGTSGGAPVLDPMWDTQDWQFDVSRVNLNEMAPLYKFLNTVDGHYNDIGHGHTEGKAKAFWDDYGMYVYAEMTFHDYLESAGASPTARATVVTPPAATAADNNAHMYDSLEIFTNERVQTYTQGGYGIQYRVAPSPDGQTVAGTNSRISGNSPSANAGTGADAVSIFRESGKYYTWIRSEAGKEVGYSIVAYVPWMFKADASANQIFDSNGKVKTTGNNEGPTVGTEFQLNTVTVGGTRDAILTWNGVNGQSYNQVKNYGKITMVTGDLSARGITRGAKDPTPATVTFDTDGAGSISSIQVLINQSAGSAFPANPSKTGYKFNGWWDESVTPNVRYSANTVITKNVTLKAHWIDKTDMVFSLEDWIAANPSFNSQETSIQQSAGSVTATQPLRLNGTVPGSNYAYIDNGSLLLFIGSSGQGLHITVNSTGLNLNLAGNIYEVLFEGSVYADAASPSSSAPELRIQKYTTGETNLWTRTITHTPGDTFSFGGELPDSAADATSIRFTSGSGGAGMIFRLTDIMIINKGSRGIQAPVAADFTVSKLNQTEGGVTDVSITPKPGKSNGAITIYYEGTDGTTYAKSQTLPTAIGKYAVTFDVAAVASLWEAASGLAGGTLTIAEGEIVGPGMLFSLADWIDEHPQYDSQANSIPSGSSDNNTSASSPFRLNGTVPAQNYAYIDNGSLIVFISGAGQGLHIMNQNNLNLDPTHKYEITIKGSTYADGTGSGTAYLRLNAMNGSTSGGDNSGLPQQNVSHTVGSEFTWSGELPSSDTFTSLRLTVSSAAAGMTFKFTSIEIEDKGPR
jgi:uncharacterized repeat protein (TIGR02543 family)